MPTTSPPNLVEFQVVIENGVFGIHDYRVGEISSTDFSTGFSLITGDPNTLQTWKLSKKIPLTILRRLNYVLTRKNVKLKIEMDEIGHFRAISRFFTILSL